MTLLKNCPCGRGLYVECCQPLHLEQQYAQNAEQLMRSRYSAFALQQVDWAAGLFRSCCDCRLEQIESMAQTRSGTTSAKAR